MVLFLLFSESSFYLVKFLFYLLQSLLTLHKKRSFPFRISSVNVTKSAVSCGLFTFTEEVLNGKFHFLCSVI